MEETPLQNMPFERLRDLPRCRLVTMSGEILTIDKSHNKKSDGLFPNDESKCKGKGKGKAVPLQASSGPEGSRKLRFSDFKTTVEDGGKVVSFTHRSPLPPGNEVQREINFQ